MGWNLRFQDETGLSTVEVSSLAMEMRVGPGGWVAGNAGCQGEQGQERRCLGLRSPLTHSNQSCCVPGPRLVEHNLATEQGGQKGIHVLCSNILFWKIFNLSPK